MILRYVMQLLLEISAFFAWFIILVLGTLPRGMHDMMVLANSYIARSDAYIYLLTETYPPFQDDQTRSAGEQPTPAPQAPTPPDPMPPAAGPSRAEPRRADARIGASAQTGVTGFRRAGHAAAPSRCFDCA